MNRSTRAALAFLVVAGAAMPPAAVSAAADEDPAWRDPGRAAFEEARRRDLPVFLLLTAPWNWDHFLLPERLFADPDVRRALREDCVPLRVDATLYPEFRPLYTISSGLLPSFHLLDAGGRAHVSLPPPGAEEFVYFVEQMSGPDGPPPVLDTPERLTWEVNGAKLANRIARTVVQRFSDLRVPWPVHRDLDASAYTFLTEYVGTYAWHRSMIPTLERETRELVAGALYDRVDGGFFRAFADPGRAIVHHEKTLRLNAELATVLVAAFRRTQDPARAVVAADVIRFLNEGLRTGGTTLYAGSLSADIYDASGRELRVRGADYYGRGVEDRRRLGSPQPSPEIPVGANFVVHQALREYAGAFERNDLNDAIARGAAILRERGFEDDGAARRALDLPGTGNLRDQADAGSGLLAVHAVTGDPEALAAAERVARVLRKRFRDADAGAFRNVARDADLPAPVREAPPDPAWNGAALRFLVELACVTGDDGWREAADRDLPRWAGRIPVDGYGIGDLGRAALRAERPIPLLVVIADPATEAGASLGALALRLFDPLVQVRWLDPADVRSARAFGVRPEGPPAIHVVWDGRASVPLRDARSLRDAFEAARRQVRR